MLARPPLPDGSIHDVPLGALVSFRAGRYAKQDATAKFEIQGDDAGLFRISGVETDDVVFIDDPDTGKASIATLRLAARVDGPGPIDVMQDEAVIATVEFACPEDPKQSAIRATLVSSDLSIPLIATPNLGFLHGNVISGPEDMAPGESAVFEIELFSSMGHPVPAVGVAYDTAFGADFSAVPSDPVAVPSGGQTARVNVTVICQPGAPEGQHPIGFVLIDQNGVPVPRSTGFGAEVRVVGGAVRTTIETNSIVMVAGGIAPINVRIESLRGGGTDVSYSLVPSAGFALTGAPIHIETGKTVRGTIWLEASADAPQDVTLQLNQFSFVAQTDLVPTKIFISALPPPAGGRFVVLRIYWGPKWVTGDFFVWQEMEKAIFSLLRSRYVQGFVEYGVASVTDVAVVNTVPTPRTVPAFAVESTFPDPDEDGISRFDDIQLVKLIMSMINTGRLPRPDQVQGTPLYYVLPQGGSRYRPDPKQNLGGAHGTFGFDGGPRLFGWNFQGTNVAGTTPLFSHELAEALCGRAAGTEVADPCQILMGSSAGIRVQAYLSRQRNQCVLPDMADNPDVAAAPVPPPPKS